MPLLRIETEGLSPDDAYALAAFLLERTGCQTVISRDVQAPLDSRSGYATEVMPDLQASHSVETIVLTFVAAQLVPGAQAFSKAVGKKAGEAVGDLIAQWFKPKMSRTDAARPIAVILDEGGKPIKVIEG